MVAARRKNQVHLAADEIGGQCGQPIVMVLGPAVFDREILTFDIAGFVQSLAKGSQLWCERCRRPGAEKADHWHRLLLRAHGTCRGYRGADQDNKAPTVHSILMQPQPREN